MKLRHQILYVYVTAIVRKTFGIPTFKDLNEHTYLSHNTADDDAIINKSNWTLCQHRRMIEVQKTDHVTCTNRKYRSFVFR